MRAQFSEFSYGFSLVRELSAHSLPGVAPVFPTQNEEGQEGGYDVQLDLPAVPLFLQIKRASKMVRPNVRELQYANCRLTLPFFRFHIYGRNLSEQHQLLLDFENAQNGLVLYAAPRFFLPSELNEYYEAGQVFDKSIFVKPSSIGYIADLEDHSVSYDSQRSYFCSEPREIEPLEPSDILQSCRAALGDEQMILSDKIPVISDQIDRSVEKTRETLMSKLERGSHWQRSDLDSIEEGDASSSGADRTFKRARTLPELSAKVSTLMGCQLALYQPEP